MCRFGVRECIYIVSSYSRCVVWVYTCLCAEYMYIFVFFMYLLSRTFKKNESSLFSHFSWLLFYPYMYILITLFISSAKCMSIVCQWALSDVVVVVCTWCVRISPMNVCLCIAEVRSEMAGRHVEAIETWSSSEHGRWGQMVVVSPWLLWVTWPAGEDLFASRGPAATCVAWE